uniref:Uncharacterized protein n=1 Tax=Romanomermis culicivorax TaxID=13658 RepID=A0A915J5P4_ROMCU
MDDEIDLQADVVKGQSSPAESTNFNFFFMIKGKGNKTTLKTLKFVFEYTHFNNDQSPTIR